MKEEKVKIEIWSDVVCPFCFIGKKRIEERIIIHNLGFYEAFSVCVTLTAIESLSNILVMKNTSD